jgi:large repetitive protein
MKTMIAMSVAAVSLLLGVTGVGPAVAKTPPLALECSPAANGGTLVNGVCVLPNAIAGGANDYYGIIAVNNDEVDTFTVVSGVVPPGLSVLSQYGKGGTLVFGDATQPGTFTFTVRAADADEGLTARQTYQITVTAEAPDMLLCSPGDNGGNLVNGICILPAAALGQGYEAFIITSHESGGTFAITSGSLPPGMTMPSQYGAAGTIVAGTPTQQGTSTFTVQGTDQEGQPLKQTYSITVGPPPPLQVNPTGGCASGTVGVAYQQYFFAQGGLQPWTWSLVSGSLPPGLRLTSPYAPQDNNSVLAGTPTATGAFTITMRVTDSQGANATEPSCTITISR